MDEKRILITIIIPPVIANGKYASGLSCPNGYSGVDLKNIK